jgi:hypothetical protein
MVVADRRGPGHVGAAAPAGRTPVYSPASQPLDPPRFGRALRPQLSLDAPPELGRVALPGSANRPLIGHDRLAG